MKVTRVKCAPIRTLAMLPAGSLAEEKPDWLLHSDGTLQVEDLLNVSTWEITNPTCETFHVERQIRKTGFAKKKSKAPTQS